VDVAAAVWNRAALEAGGPGPGQGDLALVAALRPHNLIMNGGLLDAVERLTAAELDVAEDGYRWLHLPEVVVIAAGVRERTRAGAPEDDYEAENLEIEADQLYGQAIPRDATLYSAFCERLEQEPDAFAALQADPFHQQRWLRNMQLGIACLAVLTSPIEHQYRRRASQVVGSTAKGGRHEEGLGS
jgi:hypothetical protein